MSQSKQEEFLQLYEPIHDRFERFCRARVYGDMDFRDLINDSLLVAYDKFETLRSKEAFLSFLFSISVHILSNYHQKKKARLFSKDDHVNAIKDVNADASQDAEIHYLYTSLSKLKEEQRECLILFEISGFSIREIAKIQSSSEAAIKQRLKRGRAKLQKIMTFESDYKTGEVQYGE